MSLRLEAGKHFAGWKSSTTFDDMRFWILQGKGFVMSLALHSDEMVTSIRSSNFPTNISSHRPLTDLTIRVLLQVPTDQTKAELTDRIRDDLTSQGRIKEATSQVYQSTTHAMPGGPCIDVHCRDVASDGFSRKPMSMLRRSHNCVDCIIGLADVICYSPASDIHTWVQPHHLATWSSLAWRSPLGTGLHYFITPWSAGRPFAFG
ncbi:hypothetical protein Fmac_020649 [Flemingia macrophylla]|uniref:Uncharacterized protein n=1 Tax=Flemingia macrophylla TaxID=520843 RepID=A0ABD1LUK6_9FABA